MGNEERKSRGSPDRPIVSHRTATVSKYHEDKRVGSRGGGYSEADDASLYGHLTVHPPNMYGVYSKPGGLKGSLDEWHDVLGYHPNTFSTKGI
eukprot:1147412-Prymnesium_polylepis.1